MGNRFRGGIQKDAMPPLHKYFGNPALTWIGRLFFHSPVGDFYCGLRGFRKDAFERMDLRTTGMEFATEMVVKATVLKLRIAEVPTTLSPDGRNRPPHLRTWRDGWRTLRFFLLYSPRWLFLYPAQPSWWPGTLLGLWLLPAPRTVGNVTFDVHTILYGAAFVLLGFQSITFAVFTKLFAISEGLLPPDPLWTSFSATSLSRSDSGRSRPGCPGHRHFVLCRGYLGVPTFRPARLLAYYENGHSCRPLFGSGSANRTGQFLSKRVGHAPAIRSRR